MYYGKISINNSTSIGGFESNNLTALTRELKSFANGQIPAGARGTITITESAVNGCPPYCDVAVYTAKWHYSRFSAAHCTWHKASIN